MNGQVRVVCHRKDQCCPVLLITMQSMKHSVCLGVCVDEEFMSDETYFCTNPLDDVKAGLMDSSGQQLPLQAVHVKCKLMDLLSQVKTDQLIHMFCSDR